MALLKFGGTALLPHIAKGGGVADDSQRETMVFCVCISLFLFEGTFVLKRGQSQVLLYKFWLCQCVSKCSIDELCMHIY